jgi:hypothetical protein
MAQRYNLAELHRGPLDGQVVQVPLQANGRPELVVGVPVPVLDESTEHFWWDTGNYFFLPAANPPKRGALWYYAYARTLPGYPTLTSEHKLRLEPDDGQTVRP